MSAHTPGPWTKSPDGVLVGANGKVVGEWGSGVSTVPRSPESEANGTIRNAAPELLEACRTAFDQADPLNPPLGYLALKAAIAKATGQVP